MSDSDSSSDDETSARLLASVDTSFLSDALYKPKEDNPKGETSKASNASTAPQTDAIKAGPPKSNRYLVEEDVVWKSDLIVTESMKKHMAGKLSQLIGTMIAFDDVSPPQPNAAAAEKLKEGCEQSGVRLLSSCPDIVDPNGPEPLVQKKPPPFRRRMLDDETEPSRADKIASSVSEPGSFCEEVRHWNGPKRRSEVYQYTQEKNGRCVENVPSNEFTAARVKNGWDESKIKSFKRKHTRP